MRDLLRDLIRDAFRRAREAGDLPLDGELPEPRLEAPREEGRGDLASNVAMVLAGALGLPPRQIADRILVHISDGDGLLSAAEVAGPGFLNFTFSTAAWRRRLLEILKAGESYGGADLGEGRKAQVEFVSANPTGPLHIGHGRGAATGDALARILSAAGFEVERQYYINDTGGQMETLGRSVRARCLEICDREVEFPEDGYGGEYLTEVAREIVEDIGEGCLDGDAEEVAAALGERAGDMLLARIKTDLADLGVTFDCFRSEKELRRQGAVEEAIDELDAGGHVFEEAGAKWFRSTAFGDDKDRPLVKSGGEPTYFASDVAYHREKFADSSGPVVDVWGADHHGYVKRVRSALEAIGADAERLAVVLVQMVNLTRDGEPVRMGKRSGEFVALADVVSEVGPDLARFFFLMRRSDAQLEFDLELARRRSAENPVYYVQYAYTRIAGIFRQAAEKGVEAPAATSDAVEVLGNADELSLVKLLDEFPAVVEASALKMEPHRVVFYAQRLAGEFHRFYTRNRCVSDDERLTAGRLLLVAAVRQVIGRALGLVGVRAPERM